MPLPDHAGPAIEWQDIRLPNNARFREGFLYIQRDEMGRIMTVVWELDNRYSTPIRIGSVVVHQFSPMLKAFGMVSKFLAHDGQDAVLRVAITSWKTSNGLKYPGYQTFAYLVAPLVTCEPKYAVEFLCIPHAIRDYIYTVVNTVRRPFIDHAISGVDVEMNPLTAAVTTDYVECDVMQYFSTLRGSTKVFLPTEPKDVLIDNELHSGDCSACDLKCGWPRSVTGTGC